MGHNDKTRGLFNKYIVTRADGVEHTGAEYFVLRLDTRNPAALAAMSVYADEVAAEYPALARDLRRQYRLRAEIPHRTVKASLAIGVLVTAAVLLGLLLMILTGINPSDGSGPPSVLGVAAFLALALGMVVWQVWGLWRVSRRAGVELATHTVQALAFGAVGLFLDALTNGMSGWKVWLIDLGVIIVAAVALYKGLTRLETRLLRRANLG